MMFIKIELISSTDYFRMNHIEIKHHTEIMQKHVKKHFGKKETNLFGLDQLSENTS